MPYGSRPDTNGGGPEFWRRFSATFYFDRPGDEVSGELVACWPEGKGDDAVPAIRLLAADGRRYDLTVSQERLKAELVRLAPARGDRVRIAYVADAGRAAPGMTPAKLFAVEVCPRGVDPSTGEKLVDQVAAEDAEAKAAEWLISDAHAYVRPSLLAISEGPQRARNHWAVVMRRANIDPDPDTWSRSTVELVAQLLQSEKLFVEPRPVPASTGDAP